MKRKGCLILLVSLLTISVHAATMQEIFLSMPATLLPTLPQRARQDLVDFYTNNRTAAMPAAFNNQVLLKMLTSDYLFLQTSPTSSLQVKRLPVNDTMTVLALIHTAQGPLEDSRLSFFSQDWKPLSQWRQPMVKPSWFLTTCDDGLAGRFDADCARLFVRLAWTPGSTDLMATHRLKVDVPAETWKPYEGLVMDTLRLVWSDRGYEPAFNRAPVAGHNSTVPVKSVGSVITLPN